MTIGCLRGYRPAIHCRSALCSAGRQTIPAEDSLTATAGSSAWYWIFEHIYARPMFPIMNGTQGNMALGSRAINCAPWCMIAQDTKVAFQCQGMQTNK